MNEKRYEVYDGSTKLASDMNLDTVFCLIKGYVDTYFNQPLKITIKEMELCGEGKENNRNEE